MTPLDAGIEIGPGESVELRPGGDHLMLLDLVRPLEAGDRFEVVLEFEAGGSRAVAASVRNPS
jgi:copper(I)-binding protein